MARAGISGFGVVSALGAGVAATRRGLFADPPKLPELPKGFETKLDLPVFEVEVPAGAPEGVGLPLKYLLFALDEALAAAKLTREDLRRLRVGVAVGTTVACQLDDLSCHAQLRQGDLSDLAPGVAYTRGMPAEYLRCILGLNGPALTVSNACASGGDAALFALDWLKTGSCDLVIAGGCDSVSKVAFNGFNALRVCAHAPCRPFDAARSGLNLGAGAGVVIIEDPERAAARGVKVEYELGGAGKTADAFHITQPDPEGKELERAIRISLAEAGVPASETDFVNAHGTGTLVNDRVESAVLGRVFGPEVRFQSTKALTGHTLGAAGAIELVFTLIMLQQRWACASRRYERASGEIPFAPLVQTTPIRGEAAVSTSLAFGGSNTSLVVRKVREAAGAGKIADMYVGAFKLLGPGEPEPSQLVALCRKYGLRRPDRLTQLALAAAEEVAPALTGGGETALLTVTSYGSAGMTCRVLDDILDYPEEEILPTAFSNSVVNAAASYLGTSFKIHGPTFAFAGFEDPFFEAVDFARVLLSSGRCRRVLVVGADEESVTSRAVETLRKSAPPLRAEGAFALVLTADPGAGRFGRLATERGSSDGTRRILSCGVPETLPAALAGAASGSVVTLARLAAPEFSLG